MKKALVGLLTLAMLVNMVSVFAIDTRDSKNELTDATAIVSRYECDESSENLTSIVASDLQLLYEVSSLFSADKLTIVGTTETGKIVYEMAFSKNIKSQISVSTDADDGILLTIQEGDLQNSLKFVDEKIYLNGNEVIFSAPKAIAETNAKPEIIRPQSFIPYNVYADTPFYGKASDYVNYTGSQQVDDINCRSVWRDVAKGALTLLIATSLEISGLGAIGSYSDLFMDLVDLIIDEGMKLPNAPAHVSYKYYTYLPNTQPSNSIHMKIIAHFYSEVNCTGKAIVDVFYQGYYYSP